MEKKTQFLLGKLTISMAMFNSKLLHCRRVFCWWYPPCPGAKWWQGAWWSRHQMTPDGELTERPMENHSPQLFGPNRVWFLYKNPSFPGRFTGLGRDQIYPNWSFPSDKAWKLIRGIPSLLCLKAGWRRSMDRLQPSAAYAGISAPLSRVSWLSCQAQV